MEVLSKPGHFINTLRRFPQVPDRLIWGGKLHGTPGWNWEGKEMLCDFICGKIMEEGFFGGEGRDKLNCLKDFAIQTGPMTLPSNSNICCFLSMAGGGDEESSRGRADWRASNFFEIQPHI